MNRWIAGDKIIPPLGTPIFHILHQTATQHLPSSTYHFLSPAHINSQSLDNICLFSSEARGVRMLAGNCSQPLSCSWAVQQLIQQFIQLYIYTRPNKSHVCPNACPALSSHLSLTRDDTSDQNALSAPFYPLFLGCMEGQHLLGQ